MMLRFMMQELLLLRTILLNADGTYLDVVSVSGSQSHGFEGVRTTISSLENYRQIVWSVECGERSVKRGEERREERGGK